MDLRSLPSVDALSQSPVLAEFPERIRVRAARMAIEAARALVRNGREADVEGLAFERAKDLSGRSLRSAINLSGVILHTGLGRARLAREASEHIRAVAESHALVEFDPEDGKRGNRQDHVRDMLMCLTGAEDAHVVNNAGGAGLLALRALAGSREVVLSRGEMVEIGGAFRMPDVVRESGCNLREVGCTNKTHLSDYQEALGPNTGAVLRCHASNFKIVGFTSQPSLEELASLARECGAPCVDDMGTGCILDLTAFGLEKLPTMQESLKSGADVVIGSGDKLLGGAQAGR